jgi:hypothetical protein
MALMIRVYIFRRLLSVESTPNWQVNFSCRR